MKNARIWINYFLLKGWMFLIGSIKKADCLVVLAFGLNSDPGSLGGTNDINLFLKLKEKGFDAGRPNRELAREATALSREYSIPLILQWEIAYVLWKEHRQFYLDNLDRIFCVWPKNDGSYLSSRGVLEEALKIMKEKNWYALAIIAQKYHICRVFLLFKKMLRRKEIEIIVPRQNVGSFDKDSIQKWTRTKFRWYLQESLARIHHLILGVGVKNSSW